MRLLDTSHIIKRLSVIVVMATTIFGAIIGVMQNSKKEADAITQEGANVTVNPGAELYNYGDWETHKYSIQSGATTFVGFCANPTKRTSAGSYPADLIDSSAEKYKKIQLAIYIYTVRNEYTSPIMEDWFQSISNENTRYAYIHGIVGYLNDGTTLGLSNEQIGWLENINQQLRNRIGENAEVWQQASRYQLYGLTLSSSNLQNIMWIEPKPFGSIKVTKKDATTNSANPQGNASFNGIKLTAKKGQIEKSCTLNNSNSCTISDLEYGVYTVSESAGNNTYQVNVTKTVTVDESTEEVEFKNEVKKGSIKVRKKDSKMQDGVCKTTSGHSFNGITFGLYLDGSTKNPIYYGGQTYQPNGGLIARKAIGQNGCEVTFDNLPVAKYYIKEISANNDYILSDEIKYAEITATNNSTAIEVEFSNAPTSLGTVATDKNDGDHYVEAQNNATIVDKVNYCVEPGRQYIIKGVLMDKSTGKELLIGGKKIESSVGVKPTTSCGSATMEFVIDARGLGGKDVVVFERLYEYKNNGNYENENPIVKHENINDSKQTITIISLGTVATDKNDGDHYVEAQNNATIVDKVNYCVEPGRQYIIKGVLMDKSTGKELLIGGKKIESSVGVKPTTSCGSATMEFVIDARGLGGKDVVVFERLYEYKDNGNYENEDPFVKHENINDSKQTITIISMGTEAKDGIDDDKQILADKTAVVKDTISYCLKPGQKYTIRGTLIDKATGEPLLVDGNKIEGAIEIEPTEACGTAEMLFHFDATGMGGKEVVAFERLYIFKAETNDEGDPIIVHEDPNDEAQTVFIYLPPPNTGRFASKEGDGQISGSILVPVAIITLVGGYGIYRATAKKRFLRKR